MLFKKNHGFMMIQQCIFLIMVCGVVMGVSGNGLVSLRNEWSRDNRDVSVMECVAPFGHPSANGQVCECCPGYHGTGCTSRNTCHDRVCLNGGQCDAGRGICMSNRC